MLSSVIDNLFEDFLLSSPSSQPICLFCGKLVDDEMATAQLHDKEHKDGFDWSRKLPPHCVEECVFIERKIAFWSPGRKPNPEITRIAWERKLSRKAAATYRRRHLVNQSKTTDVN